MPIGIAAFQLEAEPHLFRRGEAERGVVDLEVADQRGQAQAATCIVRLAVRDDRSM